MGQKVVNLHDITLNRWFGNMIGKCSKIPMSNLTQQMEALNFNSYIAFSLSTLAATVQQWQNHLDAMKVDGTFETIWNRRFEGVPML